MKRKVQRSRGMVREGERWIVSRFLTLKRNPPVLPRCATFPNTDACARQRW